MEAYKKLIEASHVIFLPFTGEQKWIELSSDRTITEIHEMHRKYPGQRYISSEFNISNTKGYVLVSKRYIRENVNGMFHASKDELVEVAENMIGRLLQQLQK